LAKLAEAETGLKIAVLVDDGKVPRFALEVIDAVAGCDEIAVFSCANTRNPLRVLRHGAYYMLNLLSVRNSWTKRLSVQAGRKRVASTVEFASGFDGMWQVLPDSVVEALRGFDIVLKFGVGLMRVPDPSSLPVPILSYHHGDPDKYRGRPAGFWEMKAGEPVMGQMIQVIGNRLDAGQVVAYAETKVRPWSYRATLIDSYRHSPLLINAAIRNALAGVDLGKPCGGRNWRLPSNLTVIGFCARMAARMARRLLYGGFFEKRWNVSTAAAPEGGTVALLDRFPQSAAWRTLPVAQGYSFYADPFFTQDPPGILVEALRADSGVGEIVLATGDRHRPVSREPGHLSYPATFVLNGDQLIIPEMATWSPPKVFRLEDGRMREVAALRIGGDPGVIDPTLVAHGGRLWLFGNVQDVGFNALYLWSADRLDGLFRPHPEAPIRISPEGSRMAGSLIEEGGRLFRLGQDFRFGYGDGIYVFEVETMTEERYREKPLGLIRFRDRRGPHALDVKDGELVFDWYEDRFSLFAGLRRLLARQGG
jgi:hypothetical protein